MNIVDYQRIIAKIAKTNRVPINIVKKEMEDAVILWYKYNPEEWAKIRTNGKEPTCEESTIHFLEMVMVELSRE